MASRRLGKAVIDSADKRKEAEWGRVNNRIGTLSTNRCAFVRVKFTYYVSLLLLLGVAVVSLLARRASVYEKSWSATKDKPYDNDTVVEYPVIDAVITWVNGSEQQFLAQLANYTSTPEKARYRDFGQLRYTLRSIMTYAPWIRKTYLVVSDRATQTPFWLDADHPFLQIVEHNEIWEDPSQLPVFNSNAIEANLHRIPGLAANFLYFNDDVALTKRLYPYRHLWDGSNSSKQIFYEAWNAPTHMDSVSDSFGKALVHVSRLFANKYGSKYTYKVPAHGPLLMNKPVVYAIQTEWKSQYDRMMKDARFRTKFDMQTQFTYVNYVKSKLDKDDKHAYEFRVVNDLTEILHFDAIVGDREANQRKFNGIKNHPRLFLCLQDDVQEESSDELANDVQSFYEELFPVRAPWERNV